MTTRPEPDRVPLNRGLLIPVPANPNVDSRDPRIVAEADRYINLIARITRMTSSFKNILRQYNIITPRAFDDYMGLLDALVYVMTTTKNVSVSRAHEHYAIACTIQLEFATALEESGFSSDVEDLLIDINNNS